MVADSFELLCGKWWTFLLRGIIALSLAVLAFALPAATAGALVYVAAAYFVVDGALALFAGFSFSGSGHWWALVLMGIAQEFLGVVMFNEPGAGPLALAYLVAIWSFSTGLMEILAAIALRRYIADEFWWILLGAISLVYSAYVIVRPDVGVLVLVYSLGIYAALAGGALIALAFRIKSAAAKVEKLAAGVRALVEGDSPVKSCWSPLLVALVSLGLCSSALAQAFNAAADPAFQKLLGVNAGLRSYTAHITVHTRLPLSSFTLHGTLYGKNGRVKIVFEDIPAIAKSTVENQPELPPPSAWAASYAISVTAKDALTTTYHLVPLAEQPVNAVDAVVQNESGLVRRYVWSNKNGLTITSDQTFASVGAYQLVQTTTTKTRGVGIRADSQTTFSDYQLGAAVPDSLFPGK